MYHKMTFEIDNKMLQSYNDRRFKKGDIVFFIRNNQGAIDWGEIESVFSDRNILNLYELRDRRTVEGVPIGKYKFNPEQSDWRKLPNNFFKEYDELKSGDDENGVWQSSEYRKDMKSKELFEEGESYLEGEQEWLKKPMRNVDVIREGIDKGFYVLPSSQDKELHAVTEVTKNGWRIVLVHDQPQLWTMNYPQQLKRRSDYISVPFYQTYATYAEAEYFIKQYRAELERQSNLSDYEFDMEHLERVLELCCFNTDDEKDTIRKVVGKMFRDGKDIDMKNSSGRFLWRKSGMVKWTEVVGDES